MVTITKIFVICFMTARINTQLYRFYFVLQLQVIHIYLSLPLKHFHQQTWMREIKKQKNRPHGNENESNHGDQKYESHLETFVDENLEDEFYM